MERYHCRCGASPLESFWAHHETSERHQDYLKNQVEKEKEILKEVYEGENLEVRVWSATIPCECGGHYTRQHRRAHSKTAKHQRYLQSRNDD